MISEQNLTECFINLSTEARELYLSSKVPRIKVPTPLKFYREFVSTNLPCIISGAIDEWPALQIWNPSYLRRKIGKKVVSVAVTPNGYADAITDGFFMMPEERTMKMSDFLDITERRTKENGVFYIQKQNSNLLTEFSEIISDVSQDVDWATEAFGKSPDAMNFWYGDEDSITSLHKDHYENLYCVVKGEKHFTLFPPTDLPYIPYETCQAAVYKESKEGGFEKLVDKETGRVSWIPVDPLNPDLKRFPEFAHAQAIQCSLRAGEMLYLPSLWFHHVRQDRGTIAVNYWYDMDYGIKYNYFKFMEKILQCTTSKKISH